MTPSILQKILEDAHEAKLTGERCLAIFDLDSTLFDLTKRVQEILKSFTLEPRWAEKYPDQCAQLAKVLVSPRDWGINESMERAGLFEKDHPEFYRDILEHWAQLFFSNDYLHQDEPLPGAVEFVRALEAEEAQIMYLTGRDVGRMLEGTETSLKRWKFPLDEEHVELVLKPVAEMDDAEFKSMIICDCADEFDRIWLFENEPVNLNLVAQTCPMVNLVFIDTTHSRREQPAANLVGIPHFEVDMLSFARFKKSRV